MNHPWPADSQGLQVADLLVDLRYRRVVTADSESELQQRVFDLLLLLMAEPNRLFTRAELFDRLWAGLVVDDANLSQSVWLLRKALGESRREWIRTVAKRGYVFQPPGPVMWFAAMPAFGDDGAVVHPSPAVLPAAPPMDAPLTTQKEVVPGPVHDPDTGHVADVPAAPAGSRRPRFLKRCFAALAVVALSCALAVWMYSPRVAGPTPVVLMPIHGETGTDVPWASELLRHWLGWKLGQLPDVRLVSAEELTSGADLDHPVVVMLSAIRTPDGKSVTVRARTQRDGRETVLQDTVPIAGVPALVDRLSAKLMVALVPGRTDNWPALELDAASAERYLPAGAAFDRADWQAVEQLAPGVLTSAPRFGLMHLQLATAQHRLGETSQAIRQLEIASRLLTPLPEEAQASLNALKLEFDPRRNQDAERALIGLVSRHPGYAPYQERYVGLLIGTGQYSKALSEIERNRTLGTDTLTRRFERELQYADIYYALGQHERSRRHARAAYALTEGAGDALRGQRAEAALVEARAIAASSAQEGSAAYRRASGLLLLAGSRGRAEYADILADVNASQVAGAQGQQALAAALERARRAGALGLEADILVSLANTSVSDTDRMQWLRQALETAQAMGNFNLQGEIEAELARDDLVQLRIPEARARATHLQALALEGVAGIRVNAILSRIFELEGRVGDALDASRLAMRAVPDDPAGFGVDRAAAYCATLRLATLAGDPAPEALVAGCAKGEEGAARFEAAWTLGLVAQLRGQAQPAHDNIEVAMELVRDGDATAAPGSPESRMAVRLRLAALVLRAGDTVTARRLADQMQADAAAHALPPLQRGLLAVLEAEIDAAEGDWDSSRRRADATRKELPPGAWELIDRLDLLQIAKEQRAGRPSQALVLAKALHARAVRQRDLRTQQQVLSLVSPASLGLAAGPGQDPPEGQQVLPGATMAWLGGIDEQVRPGKG